MNSKDKKYGAGIRTPGLSKDQLKREYEEWQESSVPYDEVQEERGYNGPIKAADLIAKYVTETERANYKILDVGAGTGLVGKELNELGFKDIDALEPFETLRKDAEKKGVYRKIHECSMTEQNTAGIEADSYDGLVSCGCFMENHLPVKVLDEMIRVVKPDGIIVNVTRLRYLTEVAAYNGKLEPYIEQLEQDGKLEFLSKEEFPKYYLEDKGVAWVHRKRSGSQSATP